MQIENYKYIDWKNDERLKKKLISYYKKKYIHEFNDDQATRCVELLYKFTDDSENKKDSGFYWVSRNLDAYCNTLCPQALITAYPIEDIILVLENLNGNQKITYRESGNESIILEINR